MATFYQNLFLGLALLLCLEVKVGSARSLQEENHVASTTMPVSRQYGEDCFWEGEEHRQNITKFILLGGQPNRQQFAVLVGDFLNNMGYEICSLADLLVCDKDTRKCVCGDSDHEALYGVNRTNYVLEEDGKCKRSTDSYCFIETGNSERSSTLDWCRTGTTCKTTDGDACSLDAIHSYRNSSSSGSCNDVVQAILEARICSCQPNQTDAFDLDAKKMTAAQLEEMKRNYAERSVALKLGDDCSWEAKQYRQNFTKPYYEMLDVGGGELADMELQFMAEAVARNYRFCSEGDMLVCDRESEKCTCGLEFVEAIHGIRRTDYVLENGTCRWSTGAMCVTEDMTSEEIDSEIPAVDYNVECRQGTSCQTGDGAICSWEMVQSYFVETGVELYDDNDNLLNLNLATELWSGRICSCKADTNLNG